MNIDPADAHELMDIAREAGADVLEGALRYPSETGGWQLGDLDLSEYLDQYRDQELVIIIALVGRAPDPTYTCGTCGFVMNEVGECMWYGPSGNEIARGMQCEGKRRSAVLGYLAGDEDGAGE